MNSYNWNISMGGIINYGSGTNIITVSWLISGAQWVSVSYISPSGCTNPNPTQLNITVNPLPGPAGTITGTDTVCAGTNNVAYSVAPIPNTIVYIWSIPPNDTIASGAGTNSITVDFAANASSGDINVYGNNICGDGTDSPSFLVTVNPIPPTPVVTNHGDTLYSSAVTGNHWYFQGTSIPGANAQTYLATQDGYYWDLVKLNDCSSDTSKQVLIVTTGIDMYSLPVINLYPVPNEGIFNISISTTSEETFSISVYNTLGVKIYEETKVDVNSSLQNVIDLRPLPDGVYTVIFKSSQNQVVKKIIVNK
jgi:hypothetical protein